MSFASLPTRAATSLPRGARIALLTERGLFALATSLVGLHLVDDNFLQPQPGTSAGDHLVSGRCLWQSSRWS